jgi:hypothetical protein
VYSGKLSKRNMTTGAKVWGSDVTVSNASTAADIVVTSGYVYVGTTTGTVNQYDSDGTLTYSYATGVSVDFPLLVQGATMYITPATDKLYARQSSNMGEKWASSVTLAAANTGPAYKANYDSLIYVAAGTKVQQIVDRGTSGAVKWSFDASATIHSGPIEYNGIVYFGRNSGRYYAINASNPSSPVSDWPYQSASGNATTGPWIDRTNNLVLFGTDAGNLHAFAAETP